MKRTLENCSLIRKLGSVRQYDGKCEGFQRSDMDDEPCDICKECKLNVYYEEQ